VPKVVILSGQKQFLPIFTKKHKSSNLLKNELKVLNVISDLRTNHPMPVYLHLANLIVDKAAVAQKYAGGIEQFRLDFNLNKS
jgi:hypothetical protein